jgi:hypothetical protein
MTIFSPLEISLKSIPGVAISSPSDTPKRMTARKPIGAKNKISVFSALAHSKYQRRPNLVAFSVCTRNVHEIRIVVRSYCDMQVPAANHAF